MWHDDEWMKKNIPDENEFDYSQIDSLSTFNDTHPQVMQERIKKMNWKFSFDPTKRKAPLKNRFLGFMEKRFGLQLGEYRNYRLI